MTKETGGPAFPGIREFQLNGSEGKEYMQGMTLRDYIAVHADHNEVKDFIGFHNLAKNFPEARYQYSDAMLAARKDFDESK